MEQERQRAQAHSKRGGAKIKGTTFRPSTVPRSSPHTERKNSVAPPPQILSAGRRSSASSSRAYPLSTKRFKLSPKPENPSARNNPLAAKHFRDALFPQEGESPAERRNAFFLSLLYALIYAGCSMLCVTPMNILTARMAFPLSAVIRALLPARIGTALCALTRLRFPETPRVLFSAYRRLLWETLLTFLALQALLWGEWDAQRMIARFMLAFVAAPLVTGSAVSVWLLYRDWRNAGAETG